MARPLRKYDITTVRQDGDKKFYDRIGEIIVWPGDNGEERLQTRLFLFPETNFATFLQKPKDANNAPSAAPSSAPSNDAPSAAPSMDDQINIEDIQF